MKNLKIKLALFAIAIMGAEMGYPVIGEWRRNVIYPERENYADDGNVVIQSMATAGYRPPQEIEDVIIQSMESEDNQDQSTEIVASEEIAASETAQPEDQSVESSPEVASSQEIQSDDQTVAPESAGEENQSDASAAISQEPEQVAAPEEPQVQESIQTSSDQPVEPAHQEFFTEPAAPEATEQQPETESVVSPAPEVAQAEASMHDAVESSEHMKEQVKHDESLKIEDQAAPTPEQTLPAIPQPVEPAHEEAPMVAPAQTIAVNNIAYVGPVVAEAPTPQVSLELPAAHVEEKIVYVYPVYDAVKATVKHVQEKSIGAFHYISEKVVSLFKKINS